MFPANHAVLLGCLSSVHNTEDVGGHAVVGAQVGERFNGLGQHVPVVLCWLVVISESVVELQAVLLQRRHHPSPLLQHTNLCRYYKQALLVTYCGKRVVWQSEVYHLSASDGDHHDDHLEGQISQHNCHN